MACRKWGGSSSVYIVITFVMFFISFVYLLLFIYNDLLFILFIFPFWEAQEEGKTKGGKTTTWLPQRTLLQLHLCFYLYPILRTNTKLVKLNAIVSVHLFEIWYLTINCQRALKISTFTFGDNNRTYLDFFHLCLKHHFRKLQI